MTRSLPASESLARIAAEDGAVRAFVRLDPGAMAAAEAAAARAPLHGLPVAIKDIIDTAGLGTECGTAALAGRVPARDAACVARLKAAGAVIIGKTATTELAHVTPTVTRNPRDLRRTPGGSSSGSAAAVAAGMVPVALGTQTGGSVIRPASYCGIAGFKSSIGRTELAGVHELAGSMDTVGWMARGAADLRLIGSVLLQPPRAAGPSPDRPRIGLAATPYDHLAEPAVHAGLARAAERLAGAAEVVPLALPAGFGALNALHRVVCSVEASVAFARYDREQPERLSAVLRAFIAEGVANRGRYAEAMAAARAGRAALADLLAGFDALMVPAATGEAPLGLESTGDAGFNLFWSLLGVPCVTLPFATGPAGMPIGLQLVGPFGRDEELLALAVRVEGWLAGCGDTPHPGPALSSSLPPCGLLHSQISRARSALKKSSPLHPLQRGERAG